MVGILRPTGTPADRALYKARTKIHPKRAQGTFRKLKWVVMAITLARPLKRENYVVVVG